MIEIIAQPKLEVAEFVNARQGLPLDHSWGYFTALGLVKDGALQAGVIFNNIDGTNLCMHVGAVDGRKWATPKFVFSVFDYPFNQLGMRRVTAPIKGSRKRAIEFVKNLGFTHDGTLKHYYADDDLHLYGLLRENCRFLEMKAA